MSESLSSGTGVPQGLGEQLSEIQRQLAAIASRMEKVETKLALGAGEDKPAAPLEAEARVRVVPQAPTPTQTPAPAPALPPRHAMPASPPPVVSPPPVAPAPVVSPLPIPVAAAEPGKETAWVPLTPEPQRPPRPVAIEPQLLRPVEPKTSAQTPEAKPVPLPVLAKPAVSPATPPIPAPPVAAPVSGPVNQPATVGPDQVPPAAATIPPHSPRPAAVPQPSPAPPIPPPPADRPQAAKQANDHGAEHGGDWENLIGGKWALWIGTASLFLAAAFFLAYSWNFLPPFARLGLGFGAGALFLGGGAFFRQRTLRWFSEGLTGAGLALLYLTIWTGSHRYGLMPDNLAFTAMMATTALGVYLAVLYDAVSLNTLAVLGGFMTPVVMNGGGGAVPGSSQSLPLLTYIAVLDSGILAVSLYKRWRGVTWLSFIGTLLLMGGSLDPYSKPTFTLYFVFLTIYFLQFVGASCFYSLKNREVTPVSDLLLLFAASAIYGYGGYALSIDLVEKLPGTFPLAVALFLGVLTFATRAQAPANKALRYSTGGLALFFLTIALPIQLKQDWWGVGWTAEGAMLLLVAWWLRSPLLRCGGQVVWLLALLPVFNSLTQTGPVSPHSLFINDRALPLLMGVIASALVALITQERRARGNEQAESGESQPLGPDGMAFLYAAYAVFGGAWLLAQEIYLSFSWSLFPSPQSWKAGALFTIACVVSGYAFLLFVLGLKARHGLIRMCAVSLSALATALPVWASLAMPENEWTPFFNLRWLAYGVVTAGLFGTMWLVAHERELLPESEREAFGVVPSVTSLFVLVGLTLEVWAGFAHNAAAYPLWQYPALFAVAIIWCGYAAMLLFLGSQWQQASLRVLGYITGICSVILLLGHASGASGIKGPSVVEITPLLNWRFLSFVIIGLLLMGQAMLAGSASATDETREPYEDEAAAQLSLVGTAILLWGATQETLTGCHHYFAQLGGHWQAISYFLVTMIWSLFAAALFVYGFKTRRDAHLGAACFIGLAGIMFLLVSDISHPRLDWSPVVNIRFAAFALAALVTWALTWPLEGNDDIARENGEPAPVYMIGLLAPMGWLAAGVALWGLTREVYEACFAYRLSLGVEWERTACYAISILWHLTAGWLLLHGAKLRRNDLVYLGYSIALLASLGVAIVSVSATRLDWTPFLNARFFSFVTGAAVLGLASSQLSRRSGLDDDTYSATLVGLMAAGLLLWGLTLEAAETCYFLRETLGTTWERWAQMSTSLVWSIYGALLLIAGINRRSRAVRIAALGLIAATILKVFILDLSFLDTGLRILSLGGLGLALIFISWLYSRYGTDCPDNKGQLSDKNALS